MKDIATALAKAQAQIKSAIKDTKGQIGQNRAYKYADLGSVFDACKKALNDNGIAIVQRTDFNGPEIWLETMLLHSSGDSIAGRYPLRPTQDTPQAYGSALTYARRYALSAMVGVVADEDDDGASASKRDEEEDPALLAAKAFTRKAIKEVGGATSVADLENWVTTWTKHIDKLREKFPDEAKQVDAGISAQRAHLTKKVAAE
jgi:hypothetical protein